MKKLIMMFCLMAGLLGLNAQTLSQSFLFDFGPNDGTNGDNTPPTADAYGHYWNNINSTAIGGTVSSLKNATNTTTSYALVVTTTGFVTNGKLNGALLSSDPAKLGDFAVNTATEDYFYTTGSASFKIAGLDISKQYKLKFFGSRTNTTDRTTQYTIQGSGTAVIGTLQTSNLNLGGTGYNGNNSNIYSADYVYPNSSGEIAVTVSAYSGGFGYVNAMKIEEYNISQVDATSISISGSDITSSNATSQMSVVYTPSNATVRPITWSVDDTNIASISSNGLLTPKKNGTVTVTASFVQNSSTISATKQINITNQYKELYISGTATTNGDVQATAIQMNATVGITGTVSAGVFELATTLNATGTLKFYASKTDAGAPVYGAGTSTGTILQGGTGITPGVSGPVLIRVYLATNTYKIYPVSPLKISQMGSSVSYGTGATSNHGYAYLFSQSLSQRYSASTGANWTLSNISVGGNTTVDVLNRWDNDLLNDGSQYVVYALSLGNEGILTGGQAIYNQFNTNLQLLISKAKSVGKIPVIANCYSRGDYGSTQYNYVKQMDLLIHQWDVASINLLGALDDGTGKWPISPINYQYGSDVNHPNDAGHAELMYAIVPSLYDALLAGKAQPTKKGNTYLAMGKAVTTDVLNFTPDNIVHSFTTTFDVKTTTSGVISTFSQSSSTGTLRIESSGFVTYISPNGGTITGSTVVNDGQWHKITLTHYYAWGKTLLYTDNILSGNLTEKLTPTTFALNNANSPDNISYREWMFYRAGMNADEVSALNSGAMLKSSLELYSPLDGLRINSSDVYVNLAQATGKIQLISVPSSNSSFVDITPAAFVQGMGDGSSAACGDLNGDGKLDIILVGYHGNYVYLNDGKGVFTLADPSKTGLDVGGMWWSSVDVADYDGDGKMDIVMQGWDGDGTKEHSFVYKGYGDGTFTKVATLAHGLSNGNVQFGDYDNDGKMDIIQTGWDGVALNGFVYIYHNDGNNVFTPISTPQIPGIADGQAKWGDLNKDGKLDIVLEGWNATKIFLGDGVGGFNVKSNSLPAYDLSFVNIVDYDNDGNLDLLFGGHVPGSSPNAWETKVAKGDGAGNFTLKDFGLPGVERGPAVIGDCDKDGFNDIFIAGWNGGGSFYIYKNDGTNNAFSPIPGVNSVIAGYPNGSLLVKDFNGDGYDEIFKCGWGVTGLYKNSLGVVTKVDQTPASKIIINTLERSIQVNVTSADASKIEVFNALGKLVVKVISSESSITIPNMKAGIYMVRVLSGTEKKTAKLIIQ